MIEKMLYKIVFERDEETKTYFAFSETLEDVQNAAIKKWTKTGTDWNYDLYLWTGSEWIHERLLANEE